MGYVPMADDALVELSQWIDEHNAAKDAEAQTWGRLSKVGEEFGEVINAWIGVTDQNPRKGVYATHDDVVKELLDVALTALCAVVHLTGDQHVTEALRDHVIRCWIRAGLMER